MSNLYDTLAGSRIAQFWIAATVLAALGLAYGVPAWRKRQIGENERAATAALSLLVTAEESFRANDRDGNKVSDFWTADLSGLNKFGLIPPDLAKADTEPLVPLVSKPVPYKGYYFKALKMDNGENPPVPYRMDTDKTGGKVHHLTKFGFVAWPAEREVTGSSIYIVNENHSIFPRRMLSKEFSKDVWPSIKPEPDLSEPPSDWPTDEEFKWYSKAF
jgi:hypothetical protein